MNGPHGLKRYGPYPLRVLRYNGAVQSLRPLPRTRPQGGEETWGEGIRAKGNAHPLPSDLEELGLAEPKVFDIDEALDFDVYENPT
jgi:hypothetical protein